MSFEKQKPLAAIKEKNGKWELQKSKQISHESKLGKNGIQTTSRNQVLCLSNRYQLPSDTKNMTTNLIEHEWYIDPQIEKKK